MMPFTFAPTRALLPDISSLHILHFTRRPVQGLATHEVSKALFSFRVLTEKLIQSNGKWFDVISWHIYKHNFNANKINIVK